MNSVVIAKFGGSVLGVDGVDIPEIIQRIKSLSKDAKVMAVFSAPLTTVEGKRRSLTDVALELGSKAEEGNVPDLIILRKTYEKILELVNSELQDKCRAIIDDCLDKVKLELETAIKKKEFADEVRSKTLAFSGEILMSHVMEYVLLSHGVKSKAVGLENWPIITDNNIESTNFLTSESNKKVEHLERLLDENNVLAKIKIKIGENEIEVDSRDFYIDNNTIGEVIENISIYLQGNNKNFFEQIPIQENGEVMNKLSLLEDAEVHEPEFSDPVLVTIDELHGKLVTLSTNSFLISLEQYLKL